MDEDTKFKKMSQRQTYEVFMLLKEHLKPDGEFVRYDEGWSDARIVDTVKLTAASARHSVLKIRIKEFGRLQAHAPAQLPQLENYKQLNDLSEAVRLLSVSVARLQNWVEIMDPDWQATVFQTKIKREE